MIVGFNHNILYQGIGFHVQTEDGGLKSPSLVSLLYHGGIIISSQKTSYADILGVDNLNQVVEDLAKEQHKGMLRRLTKGEFDQRIREFGIEIEGDSVPQEAAPVVADLSVAEAPEEVTPEADEDASEEVAALEEADNEGSWLGEEIEELEAVPLELSVDEEATSMVEAVPPAAFAEELPEAIEPAYEPPSAEDRGTYQDVSAALDDLIFSYLTGGDEKD